MSQGDEIMKKMSENYESLKSYLPSSYNQHQQSGQQYQHQMMQEGNNQSYSSHHQAAQDVHNNHHYMEDSPEPEVFDYQGMNNPATEGQQPYYSNRGNFKQHQYGGYNSSSQKPYFKKNFDSSHERKPFNNGGTSHYQSNPSGSGYQSTKKPYFNKYPGGSFGGQNQTQSVSGVTSPGAKYQGTKPQGGFSNSTSFNASASSSASGSASTFTQQQSGQHTGEASTTYRNFQERENHTFPAGEKPQGNHIAGTKIFVNNIESNVNDEEIHHYFGSYGKINDLKVFHKNDQNYSYIIFEKYEDAFRASNDPSPKPNWTVSLAKSKNTVMQYQQSSLYNPSSADRANERFGGHKQFHNNDSNGTAPFKKPFNKSYPNNQQGPSRYDKGGFTGGKNYPQRNFEGQEGDDQKFPADSHLTNILNNVNDTNQLLDIVMMNPNDVENLATNKTQINQTILVREIWISNIDEKCKLIIKEVIEDNFGPVEEVDFFDRGQQSFVFVKFYMVQTAFHAFVNKEKIAELLETEQVKLTYSDPSRRRNIIGDHEDYMKDENLSPVLYISFPYGFKVNKLVIQKIASDYGTVLNVTVKRSDDPKQTSSVLIEFKDLKDTKFAFKHMREDQEKMNPKCEFAILLNSEKFVKENNLKLKEKIKQQPNGAPNSYNNGTNSYNNSHNNYNNGPRSGAKKSYMNGNPNSKSLQQKVRKFSPEKELDINSKRNYSQHKQISLDTSQEQGYNPDQEQYQDDDDDDENFIWSGFISINKKGRCGMDAKVVSSQGQVDLDYNLIMTTKCSIQEPLKFPPYSVLVLKPTNETSIKSFRDVKAFLNTTANQAGVINAKNLIIYLLPGCEEAQQIYPHLKENNILAICHTAESIRGIRTKKDIKYDEKLQQRNLIIRQDENQDEEVNVVYDPTSILQDTSRPPVKRYNQRMHPSHMEDYQDEDIYDPNQINISKDDPKNTDLSDLIDNPALVDNMLKSLN